MDSLKKLWDFLDPNSKKMVKILGIIIGAFIAILIIISIVNLVIGTKVSYTKLENIVENSATNYYKSNKDKLPSSEGESVKVTTDTLISEKYMKEFSKYTKDTGCSGEVKVTNNNGNYLYNTFIKCDGYKTKSISEVVESSLVSSGDGLYLNNNIYYYRGENVNNYINIAGNTYRIISIDSANNIKVFSTDFGDKSYTWDDRYNSEKEQDQLGINDYSKSRIKETYDELYNNYSIELKKYIIEYNWCVGGRKNDDVSLTTDECSKTEYDFLSGINDTEFPRVSLDTNCTNLYSGACKNYNYLADAFNYTIWTISPMTDNTYRAFSISDGTIDSRNTMQSYRIPQLFNISGNNVYVSGDGSKSSPYVIK